MRATTTDPSPAVIRGLRALDALCDRVHARYLARVAREQQQPAPPPVAAPGRTVGADPQEVPMLPLEAFGPQRRAS